MEKQLRFCSTLTLIALLFCMSHSFAQTVYYVNASTGNDATGDGSPGNPYKTITKAFTISVSSGDSIKVAPGTYNTTLGETFPIEMLSGRILVGTAGALTTIIDATGSQNRVFNCFGNSSSTIIQGFTITGGFWSSLSNGSNSRGGGMYFDSGDETILQQNIVTGNIVQGYNFNTVPGAQNGGNSYGGGIYISSSSPTIRNNVISYNLAEGGYGLGYGGGFSGTPKNGGFADGGGISAAFANAGATIFNNTFYGNRAQGGSGGVTNNGEDPGGNGGNATAGGLNAGFNVIVRNNIFCKDSAIGGDASQGTIGSAIDGAVTCNTAANISYNVYFENIAITNPNGGELGSVNLFSDPLFVSATNFHFTNTSSPAYHTGTPTGAPVIDLDGATRNNPPSIGAYEGLDPLPVEIISFNAFISGKNIDLVWRTATEVNNHGFEIERRMAGGLHLEGRVHLAWDKVGFVEGNGTTNRPQSYSFTDANAKGKVFYRLKQIDRDGKFEYSQEVEVTVGEVPSVFALEQNYPNPFNPSTTIGFTLPATAGGQVSGMTTLKIYDAIGREVATLVNGNLEAGVYHQKTFDASKLSSGIYFARLHSGGKVQLKKMLLIK